MTSETRERAYYTTSLELLSLRRMTCHASRIPITALPTTHLPSIVKALPAWRAMRKEYAQWEAGLT